MRVVMAKAGSGRVRLGQGLQIPSPSRKPRVWVRPGLSPAWARNLLPECQIPSTYKQTLLAIVTEVVTYYIKYYYKI